MSFMTKITAGFILLAFIALLPTSAVAFPDEEPIIFPQWQNPETGYEIKSNPNTGVVILHQNYAILLSPDFDYPQYYPIENGENVQSAAVGDGGEIYLAVSDDDHTSVILKGRDREFSEFDTSEENIHQIWFEEGRLWKLTDTSVSHFEADSDTTVEIAPADTEHELAAVTSRASDYLWGLKTDNKLYRYSESDDTWELFAEPEPSEDPSSTYQLVHHADTLWALTDNSLRGVDAETGEAEATTMFGFTKLIFHLGRNELAAGYGVTTSFDERELKIHDGESWYEPEGYKRAINSRQLTYTNPAAYDDESWALLPSNMGYEPFDWLPGSFEEFKSLGLYDGNYVDFHQPESTHLLPIMTILGTAEIAIGPDNALWVNSFFTTQIPEGPRSGVISRYSAEGWETVPVVGNPNLNVGAYPDRNIWFNDAFDFYQVGSDSLKRRSALLKYDGPRADWEPPYIDGFSFGDEYLWYHSFNEKVYRFDLNDSSFELLEELPLPEDANIHSLEADPSENSVWLGFDDQVGRFDMDNPENLETWELDGSSVSELQVSDEYVLAMTSKNVHQFMDDEWHTIYSPEDEDQEIESGALIDEDNLYIATELYCNENEEGGYRIEGLKDGEETILKDTLTVDLSFFLYCVIPQFASDDKGNLWISDSRSVRYYGDPEEISGQRLGINQVVTSTEPEPSPETDIPAELELKQNYPNPFNAQTTIAYMLPEDTHVTLEVYNAMGQQVSQLVYEVQPEGVHEVIFDASGLASGLYIYHLRAAGEEMTREMLLVK